MTTSQKIVDTATELVQKKGFNAFSYHDISKLIGIKTASIHYHYPSKNDLGLSVISACRKRHNEAIAKIDEQYDSPLKKLNAFAEVFINTLGNDYRMCPCAMLTTDISTLPDSVKSEIQGFYIDSELWLASVLKEGIRSHIFKSDIKPNEYAKTLFASFEGAMLSAKAFEDKSRLTKSLKLIVKLIQA